MKRRLPGKSSLPLRAEHPKVNLHLFGGGIGDRGIAGALSVARDAPLVFAAAGAVETLKTTVLFEEFYLNMPVEVDSAAEDKANVTNAPSLAKAYKAVPAIKNLKSSMVIIKILGDVGVVRLKYKLSNIPLERMALQGKPP